MTKRHVFPLLTAITLQVALFSTGMVILLSLPNGVAQAIMVGITTAVYVAGIFIFEKISKRKELKFDFDAYRKRARILIPVIGGGLALTILIPTNFYLIALVFSSAATIAILELDLRVQQIY